MELQGLITTLLSSDKAEERRFAAIELSDPEIQSAEVLRALAKGLHDAEKGVRDVCTYAILHAPERDTELKAQCIAPYITDSDIEIRNLAGEILIKLGSKVAYVLLPYLNESDPDIQKFACDIIALVENSDPEILQAVAVLIDDPDSNVRTAAVDAFGKLGAAEYIDVLIDLYKRDEELQPYIIHALGLIGSEKAQDFLLDMLSQPDEFAQIAAIDALALCGNDISIAHRIMDNLPDATSEVQLIMLRTVFGMAYRLEEHVVLPPEWRHIAHRALIDEDEEIRIAGLFALGGEFYPEDVPSLLQFMKHSEEALQAHVLSIVLSSTDEQLLLEFMKSFLHLLDSDIPNEQDIVNLLPSLWGSASPQAREAFLTVAEQEYFALEDIGKHKLADIVADIDSAVAQRLIAADSQ